MKKFKYIAASILATSVLTSILAVAKPAQTPNMCSAKPYPVSNIVTRSVQGLFGMNYMASKIAESQIKKQISTLAQGNFIIKLKPYSAMDLMAGKFRGLDIKAKNINLDDLHISSFEAESLCDFIHINYNHNPIEPLSPIFIKFKSSINEDDFNKTLSYAKYSDSLTKIKAKINNTDINLVNFENPKIKIENSKIYIITQIHFSGTPKYFNLPIKIGSNLKVENNRIRLTNLEIMQDQGTNLNLVSKFLETLSPVILDLNDLEKNGYKITLKNINITENNLNLNGTVWVPSKN